MSTNPTPSMASLRKGITPLFVQGELLIHKEYDYVVLVSSAYPGKVTQVVEGSDTEFEEIEVTLFSGTVVASADDLTPVGSAIGSNSSEFEAVGPQGAFLLMNEEIYAKAQQWPDGFPQVEVSHGEDKPQDQAPSAVKFSLSELAYLTYFWSQMALNGKFSKYDAPTQTTLSTIQVAEETPDTPAQYANIMTLSFMGQHTSGTRIALAVTLPASPAPKGLTAQAVFVAGDSAFTEHTTAQNKVEVLDFIKWSLDVYENMKTELPEPAPTQVEEEA